MRKAQQFAGALLLSGALFLLWHAAKLPYYTRLGPGPGFFPLWLCGLLAVLAATMLARAIFGTPEATPADFVPDSAGWGRIACGLGGLAWAAATFDGLGFALSMTIFYPALLLAFGRRNPIEIAVLTAFGGFGVDYVFGNLLGTPLPAGTWFG